MLAFICNNVNVHDSRMHPTNVLLHEPTFFFLRYFFFILQTSMAKRH